MGAGLRGGRRTRGRCRARVFGCGAARTAWCCRRSSVSRRCGRHPADGRDSAQRESSHAVRALPGRAPWPRGLRARCCSRSATRNVGTAAPLPSAPVPSGRSDLLDPNLSRDRSPVRSAAVAAEDPVPTLSDRSIGLAALPAPQGHDAGRLEPRRPSASALGRPQRPADGVVAPVRPGRLELRRRPHGPHHAGVAGGVRPHPRRADRAAHGLVVGQRLADPVRARSRPRLVPARVPAAHPARAVGRLRRARVDGQRHRSVAGADGSRSRPTGCCSTRASSSCCSASGRSSPATTAGTRRSR